MKARLIGHETLNLWKRSRFDVKTYRVVSGFLIPGDLAVKKEFIQPMKARLKGNETSSLFRATKPRRQENKRFNS